MPIFRIKRWELLMLWQQLVMETEEPSVDVPVMDRSDPLGNLNQPFPVLVTNQLLQYCFRDCIRSASAFSAEEELSKRIKIVKHTLACVYTHR